MLRIPLLLACIALAVAADPPVVELRSTAWIVDPGKEAPVTALVRGDGDALVRAELRTLDGMTRWSQERRVALHGGDSEVAFTVATTGCAPGDHDLRVAVQRDGKPVGARSHALMIADGDDLVLIFDRDPIARGVAFDRTGVRPKEIEVDGAKTWVHEMGYDSRHDAEGWWRSVLMTLDPAYRDGKRPVADLEVVYRHEQDAPVELMADTAAGPRQVAGGWGRNPNWQTLRATLGDARFAGAKSDDPKKRLTDGCDLRFNACTADGIIRSVRVHAPDAAKPSDWSRFLSAAGFSSVNGWATAPGGKDRVALSVRNSARAAWNGVARVELCDADGHVELTREQDLSVAAGAETKIATDLDLAGRAEGEHLVRWRLLRGAKDARAQDAGWEHSCMIAGPNVAFILFEREPIVRGLDVARDKAAPVEITHDGVQRCVWSAGGGTAAQGWYRSLRMTFTDAAFRAGAAPVVDVDARYRQTSEAPVDLAADTARGSGEVVGGWGGRGPDYVRDVPLQRLHAELDDAVFAATDRKSKPETESADGCDLRYNSCNGDAQLRSIVVRRYDRAKDVQWKRLLRPLGVELGRDRYVFAPGTPITAQVKLANRAAVPFRASATVTFATDLDRALWTKEMPVDIAPASEGTLSVPIDTKELPFGVHVLHVAIGEHVRTQTLLAISDEQPLPKAKDGEFLYGTDGGSWKNARTLDWMDFMGFDLLRGCGRGQGEDLADVDAAVACLKARGLRGAMMIDPAWDPDPAKRAAENAKRAAFGKAVAAKHGAFLRWFELGNEPDLPFFFGGPTDAYVEGYLTIRDAIKAGDASVQVMNGGLCFHGDDGWRRAHEIVAKIPADKIDAWAYHGHGPGAGAERNAWNRQDQAVREAKKPATVFIETESGLFAGDPPGWRRQAQTVVEKTVFAQSKGAPFFQWFTFDIGGGDWGYRTLDGGGREPRPAVLAQRAMVKALRGLGWTAQLDLVAPQAEAHLFSAEDGRRAIVAWSDHGELSRAIAIGPRCTDAKSMDLFGNAAPLAEAAPGILQVVVAADPVFITWRAGDPAFAVAVAPPPLVVPERLRVVPGRPATLAVTVRNPSAVALKATLVAETVGAAPARVAPASRAIEVPASGHLDLALPVEVDAVQPSAWPRQWTVFAPVTGDVDLATVKDIPRTVGAAQPQVGVPEKLDLDLAPLGGGRHERRQALCFAWIESDAARAIEFGASADWWMEWYVNGERVGSTMDGGNQAPQSILAHVFTAKLKAGRNLIAVRVLSGSDGWRLVSGGPDELSPARHERDGQRDGLALSLVVGEQRLAREPIAVEVLRPVERVAGVTIDWATLAPDARLGAVVNRFVAVPEDAKHFHGDDDFSGRCWVRDDGASLRLAVAVRDDLHEPGDRCVVRIANGATLSAPREVAMTARRDEAAKTTWWEAKVPRADIGGDRFALQVVAIDDDWGEEKQRATWGEGDAPEQWFQAWLRE